MKIRIFLIYTLLLSIFYTELVGQTSRIDSLTSKLQNANKNDRVHVLNELAKSYRFSSPEKSLEYGLDALEIAIEIGDKAGEAGAFDNIGSGYIYLKKYDKALDCFQQSWSIFERLKDKSSAASALNNIGVVHHMMGNYDKALDYFERALAEFDELKDQRNVAGSMNNIANIFLKNGRYDDALEYYQKALLIKRELKDETGIKTALGSIGSIYMALKQYDKSLQHYLEALDIAQKTNDSKEEISLLFNLGNVQRNMGQSQVAIDYFQKSYDTALKVAENTDACKALIEMAEVYVEIGKLANAETSLDAGLKLAEEIGDNELRRDIFMAYYEMYKSKNNDGLALKFYKLYSETNLMLISDKKNRQFAELNLKYENIMVKNEEFLTKMSKSEDSVMLLNAALRQTDITKYFIIMVAFVLLTLLGVVLAYYVLNFRKLTSQFSLVSTQNEQLVSENAALKNQPNKHEKNTEIQAPVSNPIVTVSNSENTNSLTDNNFLLVVSARIKLLFNDFYTRTDTILSDFDSNSKESIKKAFFAMNKRATSGSKLIDDLNEWFYIQRQRYKLRNESVHLSLVVNKSIEEVKNYAIEKEIKINTKGLETDFVIEADARTIQTAVNYLVDNAVHGTLREEVVNIELKSKLGKVEIWFTDSNNTMNQDKMDEILKTDTIKIPTPDESSAVLSLLIAKEYVHRNNGSIHATATENGKQIMVSFDLKK